MDRTRPKLGPEETQAVLQRAAELDRAHRPATAPLAPETHMEAPDLERIAAESGLSPEAVRRALDELHGGALQGGPGPSRGVERFVARDAAAAVQRTFDEPPEAVEQGLSAALLRSGLEPVQKAPHVTRWEPAAGLGHALRRAAGVGGSRVWTGSSIESGVYAVPGERSCATLRADAHNLLAPIATVTGLLLAFPAGIALLVVLAYGLRWGFDGRTLIGFALVVASWALLTALVSRGVAKRRVRRLQRALERMLEQLAMPTPSHVRP